MIFKRISTDNTTEIVIQQIKSLIREGKLNPGEKLPSERKIAEQMGIGRTTVREAIQALAFSKYIQVEHGRGAFVTEYAREYDELFSFFNKFSDFSISEIMEVRILIEGSFARIAALRASEEDIKNLEKVYYDILNAENIRIFFNKDLEFHEAVARATKNPLIGSILWILGEKLQQETNKIFTFSKKTRKRTTEAFGKLIEAIKERNPDEAEKYMLQHIKELEEFVPNDFKTVKGN